jgi:hypothetical protein
LVPSAEQKAQFVVEDFTAPVVREAPENPLLELVRGCGPFQRNLGEVEIFDCPVVKLFASGRAVTRQHHIVGQRSIFLKCGAPAIETALPQKQMRAVINEVLNDDGAGIGKRNDQRVFGFGLA